MISSLTLAAAWAWARGWLVGNASIAVIGAVALGILASLGGVTWLRRDAAADAISAYQREIANARLQQVAIRQARQRQSEAVSAARAAELAEELDRAAARIADLERQLRERPRTVCYPKEVARRLNQ
ncbi:hypothetical protein [Hyphomicrobium sp.]|uniref:hypothetical protein n=1 Tax=Hyphomicrobium sp. TaxID=82 RepID=UPI00132ABB3F|nr:hypothetical protein [Hyphomicrobium sp.]KAB2937408.1 MAG: hypothetical protein F9K20_20160 [Hyphomicrobium sp.]